MFRASTPLELTVKKTWMAGTPVYGFAGFSVQVRRSFSEGGSPAMTMEKVVS
jgi:hypothetical protein